MLYWRTFVAINFNFLNGANLGPVLGRACCILAANPARAALWGCARCATPDIETDVTQK
jgi:hypothetical protein